MLISGGWMMVPAGTDRVAAPHVTPTETDMVAKGDVLPEKDGVTTLFGLLDGDHRVAAGWNGGAGHDPYGAARLDLRQNRRVRYCDFPPFQQDRFAVEPARLIRIMRDHDYGRSLCRQ